MLQVFIIFEPGLGPQWPRTFFFFLGLLSDFPCTEAFSF